MRRKLIIVLITLFALGCNGEPKEITQDGDFKIELLFEKNGCKVYRFKDGARYIYWSDCSGAVYSSYYQHSGKTQILVYDQSFTTK